MGSSSSGGLFGGVTEAIFGDGGASDARSAQRNAANQANQFSKEAWAKQQAEMEPWKQAGLKALAGLQDGSFYQKDPGYQFRLDEGNNAINSALASRGMGNSGAALKELTRYGQGFASNDYQNAFNRQNQLANYGNNASISLGNFAGGNASNLSNNAIGLGNSLGASYIGQGNRQGQLTSSLIGAGVSAYTGMPSGGGGMGKKTSEFA
jgi:hypothetical protein